jgi:N-acetylmuramoyl-L-alanine amidase
MKETYPDQQIHSLIQLLQNLLENLPGLNQVAGHEDLDTQKLPSDDDPDILIQRKLDPGPLFPWKTILNNTELKRVTETSV